MKKLLLALSLLLAPLPALAQNAITLPIAANAVADLGNGPVKVRIIAGNASIFTSQSSGIGSTSGSSTALTLTATPGTPPIVGGLISGNGIVSGTSVTAYNGTTGITLSAAATVPSSTTVSWGAACPSSAPANYIQASPMADYYIMYTQARVCGVAPNASGVNQVLIEPIFYDQVANAVATPGTPGDIAVYNSAGTGLVDTPSIATSQNVYFGSGKPWADVRSGKNGCATATGNGATSDYSAFNCQVTYMNATYSGGTVYVPCGLYEMGGNTLTVPIGVTVIGEGSSCTFLQNNNDATVVAFPVAMSGGGEGGLRDMTVFGYVNSAATQDVVTVGNGALIYFTNVVIQFGRYALNDCGVDGTILNVIAAGYTGGVISCGANWYIRDKIDGPIAAGVGTTYGFMQLTPYVGSTSGENHFTHVDLSGWTDSVDISDSTGATVEQFSESVFSSNIIVTSGEAGFVNDELGASTTFTVGASASAIVTSNFVIGGSLTITNSGTLKCGTNVGITNSGC